MLASQPTQVSGPHAGFDLLLRLRATGLHPLATVLAQADPTRRPPDEAAVHPGAVAERRVA